MTVGFAMIVHTELDRAEQVARHWAAHDCPVVIHVDKKVKRADFRAFVDRLSDVENIRFCGRHSCEWGRWSLVEASKSAAKMLLDVFPEVRHVFLASGSCLPLRPVEELKQYLAERPMTNFIESVTTEDVPWTVGGLDIERFTLRFPFSWKRHRRAFDAYVRLQRRLKFKRHIPKDVVPHLGSQWWCLTRQTLTAIFDHPRCKEFDRYFCKVWIPDESYYQTLTRLVSTNIESRSLTLSKFDFQGKPHIFYDDHLQLLRRSDCFVARKIWPRADKLYRSFLSEGPSIQAGVEPNPGKIDRIFSKAVERRTKGRPGLYMQSRFPRKGFENGLTSAPYSVFQGFDDLFEDFEGWLGRMVNARVHGHLFAQDCVEFAGRQETFAGALSASANLRNYDSRAFFTSLIWNTRGERQCFQFSPRDKQDLIWDFAKDGNAQISVISGAWAVPLFYSNANFSDIRREAARLQKRESNQIAAMKGFYAKARIRVWTLADFVENPMEPLQVIIDEIGGRTGHRLTEVPRMVPLDGFGQFLQNLKNQGMQPHLMGEFPMGDIARRKDGSQRPYLIK